MQISGCSVVWSSTEPFCRAGEVKAAPSLPYEDRARRNTWVASASAREPFRNCRRSSISSYRICRRAGAVSPTCSPPLPMQSHPQARGSRVLEASLTLDDAVASAGTREPCFRTLPITSAGDCPGIHWRKRFAAAQRTGMDDVNRRLRAWDA